MSVVSDGKTLEKCANPTLVPDRSGQGSTVECALPTTLAEGTRLQFVVTAAGFAESAPSSDYTITSNGPGDPTVTLQEKAGGKVFVTLDPPGGSSSRAVIHYQVQYRVVGTSEWNTATDDTTQKNLTFPTPSGAEDAGGSVEVRAAAFYRGSLLRKYGDPTATRPWPKVATVCRLDQRGLAWQSVEGKPRCVWKTPTT